MHQSDGIEAGQTKVLPLIDTTPRHTSLRNNLEDQQKKILRAPHLHCGAAMSLKPRKLYSCPAYANMPSIQGGADGGGTSSQTQRP
jgi:hypothetical protein